MRKLTTVLAAVIFAGCLSFAQQRNPVDTLLSKDAMFKVVLFDDMTWQYMIDDSLSFQDQDMDGSIFSKDWTENSLSAFHVTLDELSDDTFLRLDTLGGFCCPVTGDISSHYGMRKGRRHTGTDVPLNYGVPVYAAFGGKVRSSMYNTGYGNIVIIRHSNGMETYYGHLSERKVQEGDWVKAGDVIGLGGNTGRSTGPHLHFETRYMGFPFDPNRIIDFSSGTLRSTEFDLNKSYFAANSKYIDLGNSASGPVVTEVDKNARSTAQAQAPKPQKVYHRVKKSENLSVIARKYHTTVGQLCKLNGISQNSILQIDQKLRVK